MINHMCYASPLGEVIQFENGIYIDWDAVLNYSWSYEKTRNSISGVLMEVSEKEVEFSIYNKDGLNVEKTRNELFEVFEADLLNGVPGKLWFNDYYLECFIVAGSNSSYYKTRQQHTKFKLVSSDPMWHKTSLYQFEPVVELSGGDSPLDLPFDLGLATSNRKVIDVDGIGTASFELTIYGPCTDPAIEINGHRYGINGTIASNEYVVVKSYNNKQTRSITKHAYDGSSVNWFGHRVKEESIFEEIPTGKAVITWGGTFAFDLLVVANRSEPPWVVYETSSNKVEDVAFLMDGNGGLILDSDGSAILTA